MTNRDPAFWSGSRTTPSLFPDLSMVGDDQVKADAGLAITAGGSAAF
jgi:hypothetical protein